MTECYTSYLTSTNSNVILQNLTLQLGKDLEDYYKGVSGALSPTDSMTKYQNSLKALFTHQRELITVIIQPLIRL